MNILVGIWGTKGDRDGKYSSADGFQRCQRKTNMFHLSFAVFIQNKVGSYFITKKQKKISQEYLYEPFSVIISLNFKSGEIGVNFDGEVFPLRGSLSEDSDNFSSYQMEIIVKNWMNIDEDTDVINVEVEEEIQELENNTS